MPYAAALAGEDHLILVLDEVHSPGIRVHQQRTVTASAATAATRLGDDDIGHAFRVAPGRRGLRRSPAAAAATPPASAAAAVGGDAGQQLRRRNGGPEPAKAARAVRIDTNPVAFQA